jgi:hypothetical protein
LHLAEGFLAITLHNASKRVQSTDQGAVGVHGASFGVQKGATAFGGETQGRAAIGGVSGDEGSGRETLVRGQPGDLVGVKLDAFMLAAGQATVAGKTV